MVRIFEHLGLLYWKLEKILFCSNANGTMRITIPDPFPFVAMTF